MLSTLHQHIENSSCNALPSIHTLLYDGWVIRMAGGGPKRANSITVLSESTLPLRQKIAHGKALFARQDLPLIFKLMDHPDNLELDSLLAAEGLAKIDETMVMTCDLTSFPRDDQPTSNFRTLDAEVWLAHMMMIDQSSEARKRQHTSLLRMLTLPAIYGSVWIDNQCVAIGLAVVDDGYVGLFDIATDSRHRRKGHARQLSQGLLRQAQQWNAHTAYLQAVTQNTAAIALYESQGFISAYRYWYRASINVYSSKFP